MFLVPDKSAYSIVDSSPLPMSRADLDFELKNEIVHTVVRGTVISGRNHGGFGRLVIWLLILCLVFPCRRFLHVAFSLEGLLISPHASILHKATWFF